MSDPLDLEKLRALAEKATRPTQFDGYSVDAEGRVWSSSNWRGRGDRPLTPALNTHGYQRVKIKTQYGMKSKLVHQMVCEAFHGPRPTPAHQVRHLDGSRTNNRADNLAWGAPSENARDRKRHGTERAAENGRASAHKLRGVRVTHCQYGHDKEGKRDCPECHRVRNREAWRARAREKSA